MADSAPIRIRSLPGVQRDGTDFDKKAYADALWCRWQRALPRKMGGYRMVTPQMAEKVYGMHTYSLNATQYMHLGSESLLGQRRIDNSGIQTGFDDRTPAIVSDPNNLWQFDAIFDVDIKDVALVAHVAPNMDIDSDDEQPVWFGQLSGSGVLANTMYPAVSGGVVTVGNYVVAFGSGGYVTWNSTPNNLDAGNDEDFVTPQKIVKGIAVRGGGVPAAALWSLDTLLLMSLNPSGTPLWDFDTVGEISVMSSRGIIEYDGVYYWPGVDRFLAYSGVIREVPNTFNANFFFERINFQYRQKCFAFKVPRFGEIWWCFPLDDATEANHAVIYNVRENCWYDTPLPNQGRSDGIYAKVYNKPFMTGVLEGITGYTLWQHETGVNEVGPTTEPIPSYFETSEISIVGATEAPEDKALTISVVEPDFVQVGNMTLTVKGRANARSKQITHDPLPISEQQPLNIGVDAEHQIARTKFAHRLMSFKFESNEPDGNYEMGHVIGHVGPAGGRQTQ